MSRDLHEYLFFLANAPTLEELWSAHTEKMAEYGFDRIMYGFTRFRTEHSLGDPDDFIVLSNHDRSYVEAFVDSGLYHHAPMINWALSHEGAASWALLGQMRASETMTADEKRVFDYNQTQDVVAGYTLSFKSISTRAKGAASLCARKGLDQEAVDAIWAEHGTHIELMNTIAHLKILTLPYSGPNRSLTPRQREALEWVGDGKTMQDIALLMGLTSATVEKHLRLAREALSVETTAQAVMKAVLQNQMFVIEA